MSVRGTREDRPIFTGRGNAPFAIRRSKVCFETESLWAARGSVNRSRSSFVAKQGGDLRSAVDEGTE